MSEHAGKFIKQVKNQGNFGTLGLKDSKGDIGLDDLFTVADVSIQKTIEYNIKHFFPYVNIVSEEDSENTKDIEPTLRPDQIYKDLVSEKMLVSSFRKRKEQLKRYIDSEHGLGTDYEEEALNFYQEDLELWVDPLDGTKSFSSGQT